MAFYSYIIKCPRCGSYDVDRVKRNMLEKTLSRKRKYHCHNDNHTFFQKKWKDSEGSGRAHCTAQVDHLYMDINL